MNILNTLQEFGFTSTVVRLLLAVAIGGIIGMERGKHGSAAGLRTHILVCVGSAMTALTSLYVYNILGVSGDVLRLSAQVISGIGFLGAGMIIVKNSNIVIGLTTAAGMWATAAIGIATGMGYYLGAVFATLICVFTATFLNRLESKQKNNARVYIETNLSENTSHFINELKSKFDSDILIEITTPKSNVENAIAFRLTLFNINLLSDIKNFLNESENISFFFIEG